jgi:hypothetical protein
MYGIGLVEYAVLLAVAGLIAVYFGLRGQSRLGLQIAFVILLAPLVVGSLVMFVMMLLWILSGG